MKKAVGKIVSIVMTVVLVIVSQTLLSDVYGPLFGTPAMPVFDKDTHTDILDLTNIIGANYVGYEYNEDTGGRMWTDVVSGGNASLKLVDNSLTKDADYIYGSGSVKYKASGYTPNQAYHYPFVAIAKMTETGADKSGYLSLKFPAGGECAKLSFINPAGEDTVDYAELYSFPQITTNIGNSHTFSYRISVEDYKLSVWMDDSIVLNEYALNAKYAIDRLAVGSGRYYASFNLTNYRVWRTDPVPSLNKPVPVFDKDTHTDILDLTNIIGANYVGYEYNEDTGGRMWTDVVSGGNASLKLVDNSLTKDSDYIYGSGSVKYKASGYTPNQAYHYPFVAIAKMTDGSEKSGYLSLKFPAGGECAKLSFIYPAGEDTVDYAELCAFTKVTTEIGTTHTFAYQISTEDYTLSIWLDGKIVLNEYNLDSKYTVDNLAVGSGRYYAGFNLDNYRVWRTDPVPDLNKPVPLFNEDTHYDIIDLTDISGANWVGYEYNESNGARMWTDLISGGNASLKVMDSILAKDTDYIYGSGSVKYKASGYTPNQAYHYPFVAIAKMTDGSEKSGYLALKFPAGGECAKLSFINPAGEDTVDYAELCAFTKVRTEIGTSHTFAYQISTEDYTLSIWLDGKIVLNEYKLDSKYTVDSLAVGSGRYYASFNLDNYRVWRTSPAPVEVIPIPQFDPKTDINLAPYAQVASSRLSVLLKDDKYSIAQTGNIIGTTLFRKVNLEGDGTIHYHALLEDDLANLSTSPNLAPYDGPSIVLGSVIHEETGKSGYLVLRFTAQDGIDFRISSRSGEDVYYLGAQTGMKFKYPDTRTYNRTDNVKYELDVSMSRRAISVWVNGKCIVNDVKFESFGVWPQKVIVNELIPGLIAFNYKGTINDFWFWCSKDEAPDLSSVGEEKDSPSFNKLTDIIMNSKMSAVPAGESGAYSLEKDGTYTVMSNGVGDGEGTDSGAYFSARIKRTGTMYMRGIIKSERKLDEEIETTKTYGGPAIRLADATCTVDENADRNRGFLDVLFTEKDGIDVRLRSQDGSDIVYIGGKSIGLKIPYPDTNTFERGTGDYEVVFTLSMTNISMWINGVCLLNDYKLHNIDNFDNADYHVDILDFAPGVLFNGETGTVEKIEVWCAKEDLKVARDTEYGYPSN